MNNYIDNNNINLNINNSNTPPLHNISNNDNNIYYESQSQVKSYLSSIPYNTENNNSDDNINNSNNSRDINNINNNIISSENSIRSSFPISNKHHYEINDYNLKDNYKKYEKSNSQTNILNNSYNWIHFLC